MIPRKLLKSFQSKCPKISIYGKSTLALDPVQEALLSEPCILVDPQDLPTGQATKRDCHKMNKGTSPLHRAFSLFVFNNAGELLLQQRSSTKITFPNMWTNSCCSHPLAVSEETEEKDALGVRRAAQRRIRVELGVEADKLKVEDILYLTRILYAAPSSGEWGEHELDYILLARGDPVIKPNKDEVQDFAWVKRTEIGDFLSDLDSRSVEITPWFKLISQKLLNTWWEDLDNVSRFIDHQTIHKF